LQKSLNLQNDLLAASAQSVHAQTLPLHQSLFSGCRVYHWRHRSSKALGGMDSEPLTIQVFHKEAEAWMDCEGLPAVASHCDCSEVWEYDTSNFTMPEWHSAITERKTPYNRKSQGSKRMNNFHFSWRVPRSRRPFQTRNHKEIVRDERRRRRMARRDAEIKVCHVARQKLSLNSSLWLLGPGSQPQPGPKPFDS